MPDWIERPIHEAIYTIEQSIAQVAWRFDSAALSAIDLIDRFRHGLVATGFTTALDQVATSTIGISRPVFELALVTFLLCIIAMPVVSFKWVNLKKAMFLVFVIPIGLPLLAGGFQDIDSARGELGTTFYTNIYNNAHFDMVPPDAAGNGIANDMGELTDFSEETTGYPGVHGVDVAAAYLYARRDDVFNPSSLLPVDFKQKYFFTDVGAFDGKSKNERWEQISISADGITRMVYGFILILFAMLETLVSLGFTLTMGFLLIAFMISLLFAYFSLFEGMTITILKKLADLFLQSWAISAVQALVLAALVKVATSGNGIATLGMGLLALGIQIMFMTVAWHAMIGAVTGFGTSGGLSPVNASRALMMPTAPAGRTAGGLLDAAQRTGGKAVGEAMTTGKRVVMGTIAGAALLAGRRPRTSGSLANSMGAPTGDDKTATSAYQRGSITPGKASNAAKLANHNRLQSAVVPPTYDSESINATGSAPRMEKLGIPHTRGSAARSQRRVQIATPRRRAAI